MSAHNNDGPQIDRWSDVFRPRYGYPEDVDVVDAGLSKRQTRKVVRQRKKAWRDNDKEARQEFFNRQRKEEPPSPEGRLGCALVITLVMLVLMIAGFVRGCSTEDENDPAIAPSGAATVATSEPTVAPSSTETSQQNEAVKSDLSAEETTTQWITGWLTYTPTTGDSVSEKMGRAMPFMTNELMSFLSADDPVARIYENTGTDITVIEVEVNAPPKGKAPIDTDQRVTFLVTVTSEYTAGPDIGKTFPMDYVVTVMRPAKDGPWLVADYTAQDH